MKEKRILQDKINQLQIEPSDRVWQNIAVGLDSEQRSSKFRYYKIVRRSAWGIAAAVVLMILAYFVGLKTSPVDVYLPLTLEINDQAAAVILPSEYYAHTALEVRFRKGGQLVPNALALWENPLVPREN